VFKIEQASIADVALIRELCFQVWPQTYSGILSNEQIEYMLEMMYSESSLKKQMADGAKFIFVYHNDEPVGFASYQQIKSAIFKLHKIYVLPSQQGKGTGKFVIEHIISEIKKENATALQLQVNRGNKARYFYEKLGFSVIEEINLDIGNSYVMDDYIMEKKL
jgi:GNAT superfamily N-acetyltransferase